ncbi:hypothetical protein Hanom_Chr16g01415351 [Helianthus anomalus]
MADLPDDLLSSNTYLHSDQAVLDSSIPLSPQWLYAKPGDSNTVSFIQLISIFMCRNMYGYGIIGICSSWLHSKSSLDLNNG